MNEETPSQEESRMLAEAVFANPELRERFEAMARETSTRQPVADDFDWLSPEVERDELRR